MDPRSNQGPVFSPPTQAWFDGAFSAPTPAQQGAWESIAKGNDTLVVAPTGSGKTLAAFLWALDRLAVAEPPTDPLHRCRVLYVSPLKALAVDVERNLRSPLTGIQQQARLLGRAVPEITVAMRTGDTPAADRRRFARRPSDILITTPESLFLLLTSASRAALRGVQTVIVDEVHAVAGTKRGAHLAVSLERLDRLLAGRAQRVGLSATVRPTERVAGFLSGGREVSIVSPPSRKEWDLRVEVPVEDMTAPPVDVRPEPRRDAGSPGTEGEPATVDGQQRTVPSIWPHVEERVLDLVDDGRSTLVFANSRRLAERLTSRLNDLAAERADVGVEPDGAPQPPVTPPIVARAHHGSVSREQRVAIEEALKHGTLPAVVATSSLELGIDMGAVDLVVQVEAPPSVASGLQRVGRAGHQVGAVSRGVVFPKHRGDLLTSAVVVERMRSGAIEELSVPENPLDVLAQQVVAMVAMEDYAVDELLSTVRRAAPFATLTHGVFDAVLDMLAGRYPSEDFAELRPRIVWDRVTGMVTARPGAQRLAVTSGGTIPDRGLFGVFIVGEDASRVGELDEEMVYESRLGDVFSLGTSSWRIEEITHDRVLVSPAPGQPARLPFWHGDALGRPLELGRAQGAFLREISEGEPVAAAERLAAAGLDGRAAANLLAYLTEQREALGRVPDDRTIVVERFRDELGDWQVVVHSPFGAAVHAPWALAAGARLGERFGVDVAAAHSDDGMIFRIPDTAPDSWDAPAAASGQPMPAPSEDVASLLDLIVVPAEEVESLVTRAVTGSALFASRFRECAARALLLPRQDPTRRTPLWRQRMRSAQLLEVAARYPTFPIVLETLRECVRDVYDLPGLIDILSGVEQRSIEVHEVHTEAPSPFARSLLFGYVGTFMYEGDSPLAERRAQALTLDATLLAELLGQVELRELLDAEVVSQTEAALQRLDPDRHARTAEHLADLVRELGPIATPQIKHRCAAELAAAADQALAELSAARRLIEVRIAGEPRWAAIEDAGRLRDALGCALPVGIPEAFLEPVPDAVDELVTRFARTHGPFRTDDVARWLGTGRAVVEHALHRLAADGRVVSGEFTPAESGTEWCEAGVLRRIRRRSVAALRAEAEPVSQQTFARFLPSWHAVDRPRRGLDGVLDTIEQLAGYPIPASLLESMVMTARVRGYQPSQLDELMVAGEVLWAGSGRLGSTDGWVSLHLAGSADLSLPEPQPVSAGAASVLKVLHGGGGLFFGQIVEAVTSLPATTPADGSGTDLAAAVPATSRDDVAGWLWDLVWAGTVANDTLGPLRALTRSGSRARARSGTRSGPALAAGRAGGGRASSSPRGGYRSRRWNRPSTGSMPSSVAPAPHLAGRWFALPPRETDPTVMSHALMTRLMDRYGVLTRGSVTAEQVPGGFAGVYKLLAAAEDAGRYRRGYLVDGLGGAQFAEPATVDRLRSLSDDTPGPGRSPTSTPAGVLLAATDPANPFGAALPWPESAEHGHRPGRRPGASVALLDGQLVLFLERGGKSVLTFTEDVGLLQHAAALLADAVHARRLSRIRVERIDAEPAPGTTLGAILAEHGFRRLPSGFQLTPTSA
jgi:ATP-dependent Lhr-like helicase